MLPQLVFECKFYSRVDCNQGNMVFHSHEEQCMCNLILLMTTSLALFVHELTFDIEINMCKQSGLIFENNILYTRTNLK